MAKKTAYPITIAIDPGVKGALAVKVDENAREAAFAFNGEADFVEIMQDYQSMSKREKRPIRVFLEKVGGFAGKGRTGSSMFTFGQNFGFCLGVCQALGFRVELVPPQVWQKAYPCKTKGSENYAQHKRELREHAARLFPQLKPTLATADALLILDYSVRNPKGS